MALGPLVPLSQQQQWEDYAYNYYENIADLPNGTGVSPDFGTGIWSVDFINGTAIRKHETSGVVEGIDKNWPFLFPAFQLNGGPLNVLLFSLRYGVDRAKAIDSTIECSLRLVNDASPPVNHSCGSATSLLKLVGLETRGPAALFYEPIFPRYFNNNQTKFVGIIATTLLLDETLDNVFSKKVRGIDAVYTTSNGHSFTYEIQDGLAVPKYVAISMKNMSKIGRRYLVPILTPGLFFHLCSQSGGKVIYIIRSMTLLGSLRLWHPPSSSLRNHQPTR